MADSLVVNEIYLSLQGESTFAGLPCVFVRLTACDLRCSYCDTAYAFSQGKRISLDEIEQRIDALAEPYKECAPPQRLPLVELTGGEPLLQAAARPLMATLCNNGYTVLLETSGAHEIASVDPRVHRIMDLKCPSSGESERMRLENIPHLKGTDEVKFVVSTAEDYDWAKNKIQEHRLEERCSILFSWAAPLEPHQQHPSLKVAPKDHTSISRRELAERIIADALPVRFQLQMHKFVWSPDARGV